MDSVADGESEDDHRIRCGSGCLKSLVVFINLTFMVGGAVVIGFAIWIHLYRESFVYYLLLEDSSSPAPSNLHPAHQSQQNIPSGVIQKTTVIVVVTLVAVIIAIGLLGCCGASVESLCFLCLCAVLIVSVVIAEIVIASVIPSIKEKMYSDLLVRMKYQIQTEYNRTTTTETEQHTTDNLTLAWDTLHIRFNCCGASGPRDFLFSAWFNQTKDNAGLFVPVSCCVLLESSPEKRVARDESFCQIEAILYPTSENPVTELQENGCHEVLVSYFNFYIRHPLTIVIYAVIITLQLTDLVCCCFLILWTRRRLSEMEASESEESEEDEAEEE